MNRSIIAKAPVSMTARPLDVVPMAERLPSDEIKCGTWYWVKDETEWWFGCITKKGSNYVQIKGLHGSARVHMDHFDETCRLEPNPDHVIAENTAKHQAPCDRSLLDGPRDRHRP